MERVAHSSVEYLRMYQAQFLQPANADGFIAQPEAKKTKTVATVSSIVSVGGRAVPIGQVADEDMQQMTPDEYAAYYEAYMAQK